MIKEWIIVWDCNIVCGLQLSWVQHSPALQVPLHGRLFAPPGCEFGHIFGPMGPPIHFPIPVFNGKIHGFPVDFPLNQCIDRTGSEKAMNGKLESIQAMDALRISSPLWRTQCCVYVKHPVFHGMPQIFHSTGGPFPHVSGTTKRQSLTQFQAVPWLKFDHSWRSSLLMVGIGWLNPMVSPMTSPIFSNKSHEIPMSDGFFMFCHEFSRRFS